MMYLVTSALALTVGMRPMGATTRAPAVEMKATKPIWPFVSKLPASCSMAGATPMIIGPDGKGSYAGGDTLAGDETRTGRSEDFVASYTPMGQVVGCVIPTAAAAKPTEGALQMPINAN